MSFKQEAALYNLFHADKDYKAEARALVRPYKSCKTVLEIGSGTGLLTRQLLALGCHVTAIEPSAEMLSKIRNRKNLVKVNKRLEEIKPSTFDFDQFDLVVAHYDVLNYVSHKALPSQFLKLHYWGKHVSCEMWDGCGGVKPITVKFAPGWVRIRLGFGFKKRAYLWYIYLGKGVIVEKHVIYLH